MTRSYTVNRIEHTSFLIFGVLFFFTTSTAFAQTPLGQSGTWTLIFSDEFNNGSLDTNKWEPSWFGGSNISKPVNSDEDGCYDPAQVSVGSGVLNLAAVSTTKTNCLKRDNSRASYASGLVNTRKSFTYAYGYMEARMNLPGSGGNIWNWPAFWSDGTGDWPKTGEIDVMESLSGHKPCWHYHYEDDGGHQGPGGCANSMDGTGWHTYAAKWEPGKITFYYDGQQVGTITQGVVSAVHFLILNNGINDRYGINVPATAQVDYVRVWKSGGSGTPPIPTTPPSVTPTPVLPPSSTSPASSGSVNVRISTSSDDAEEGSGGNVDISSSDLELVHEPNMLEQTVGMRFNTIAIPKGAAITNAYIQFTADEVGSSTTNLTLRGQAIGNAPTFTTASNSISSRALTSTSAPWSLLPWTSIDTAGTGQRSPNISSIIQEIVDRSDWGSGNSLAVIIKGSGSRVAQSYDLSSSKAPLLHIEFATSTPSSPPSPASITSTTTPIPPSSTTVILKPIPNPTAPSPVTVPTPAPVSYGTPAFSRFVTGDRVFTTARLNVRGSPGGARLGSQQGGTLGTIVGGPIISGNYVWWRIDYDQEHDGWSAGNYLLGGKVSGATASNTLLIQSLLQQIRELIIQIELLEAQLKAR